MQRFDVFVHLLYIEEQIISLKTGKTCEAVSEGEQKLI